MSHLSLIQLRRWFCISAVLLLIGGFPALGANNTSIKTQLVWGTDGTKPEDKNFEDLDPKIREKLRQFRFKNYWVVKAKVVEVTGNEVQKAVLSDKCTVEFKQLPDGQLEVKLFTVKADGTSKVVHTAHHASDALKKGEYLILAGDDKEKWDDSWFVIISCGKQK